MSECCAPCARRSWLLGRLAGHVERLRGDRGAVRGLLALDDAGLLAAVAGRRRHAVAGELEALDTGALVDSWSRAGATSLCRHSPRYPSRLARLEDPPAAVHLFGSAERLAELVEGPAVAVVGARNCSRDGELAAGAIARGCSASGVMVVSGMALGVDGAAHRGALEGGARTVAVLAGGPERPYPARWRALHRELGLRGAVISELPPATASYRWAFPARNRLIAALSTMVVVVEAAARSGSLITAEIAADLGVAVGAVPGAPGRPLSESTNALIRDGAALIRDAGDVLDELLGVRPPERPATAVEPELARVAALVDQGLETAEEIAGAVRDRSSVAAALTRLELLGVVERRPSGRYVPGTSAWRDAAA